MKDVAKSLGVSHVLEGSVRKAGDRVRITAQLIDGANGRPCLGRPLRPRPDRHLRHPGRNFEGHRRCAAIEAAAQGEERDRESRDVQRRGLQSLPDGAAAVDERKFRAHPPATRPSLACAARPRRSTPNYAACLGADGIGAARASILARKGRRCARQRRAGARRQSELAGSAMHPGALPRRGRPG